jgi:DNA-binding CsgD family transcriptional regulator
LVEHHVLVYVFSCFSVGLTCMGVCLFLALRRQDAVARGFLAFYSALSVTVTAALLLAYTATLPGGVTAATRFALEYLESIVGQYSIMYTLPFFAHRVYGVRGRDRLLLGITVTAAVGQHVTEFMLNSTWDERGDVAENVVFAAVLAYTLWLGIVRLGAARTRRPLGVRFLALLALGLPGLAHDLLASGDTALRFYPLWYCLLSVVVTWTLVQRPVSAGSAAIPTAGGLSERESEVVRLLQRGLSNKEIGSRLHISTNTVKTHLRAIFDKSGVRSRFGLVSRLAPAPEGLGETEGEPRH